MIFPLCIVKQTTTKVTTSTHISRWLLFRTKLMMSISFSIVFCLPQPTTPLILATADTKTRTHKQQIPTNETVSAKWVNKPTTTAAAAVMWQHGNHDLRQLEQHFTGTTTITRKQCKVYVANNKSRQRQ